MFRDVLELTLKHIFIMLFLITNSTALQALKQNVNQRPEYSIVSDEEINAYVAEGENFATQYTDPAFLYPFTHAEELAHQKQLDFNHTLQVQLPISTLPPVSIGIYNQDLLLAALLGARWSNELLLWHTIQKAFINTKSFMLLQQAENIAQLLSKSTEDANNNKEIMNSLTTLLKQQSFIKHPVLNKQLLANLVRYTFINKIITTYQEQWLIHHPVTNSFGDPIAISTLIPKEVHNILVKASPTGWLSVITDFFAYIGCHPTWANSEYIISAQDMAVLTGWLWWHERTVINPALLKYLMTHKALFTNITHVKQLEATFLEQTLKPILSLSFKTWLTLKVYHTSIGHTAMQTGIALYGAYTAGKRGYKIYKSIQEKADQPLPQENVQ